MERDDVRMRQARVNSDLTEKALPHFRIAIGPTRQRPQSFKFACGQVADLVSNACLGLIDDSKELILANSLIGLWLCHYLGTRYSPIL